MKLRSLAPATRRVVPAILALTAAFAPHSARPQDSSTSFTIPLNQPPKAAPATSGTAVKSQAVSPSPVVTSTAEKPKPAAAKSKPEGKLASAKAVTKKPAAK